MAAGQKKCAALLDPKSFTKRLREAAKVGDVAAVRRWLALGGDPTGKAGSRFGVFGSSALTLARKKGHARVVEILDEAVAAKMLRRASHLLDPGRPGGGGGGGLT